jgi:hypothetical protein
LELDEEFDIEIPFKTGGTRQNQLQACLVNWANQPTLLAVITDILVILDSIAHEPDAILKQGSY